MADDLRANALINDSLGSALRSGDHALGTVPALLKKALGGETWRDFVTKRGEPVHHERFEAFVIAKPLRGLGADMALIDRLAGTNDPDLLRLLREAKKIGQGKRRPNGESPRSHGGQDTDYQAERLAAEAPSEYEAVKRGDQTIHAAAVSAGIRKRRIPIRLDSAESAAQSLRKHMPPDTRRALARLLLDD